MKNIIPWLAVMAVILVVLNVCFFTVVYGATNIAPSVWVSYAFVHLAFLLTLCTPLMVERGNSAEADYRRPLYAITWIYFIVALLVNLAFIIVSLNSVVMQQYVELQLSPQEGFLPWLVQHLSGQEGVVAAWLLKLLGTPIKVGTAIITNVVLLGAAVVLLIVNVAANADTAAQQERHEQELHYVKDSASRLKYIATSATDKALGRKVSLLCDLVSSSPLRSCPEAEKLERELMGQLNALEDACGASDEAEVTRLCAEMTDKARRRNRIVSEKA